MSKKKTNADVVFDLFQYKVSVTEAQWLLELAKGIVKRREIEEGVVTRKPRKKKTLIHVSGGVPMEVNDNGE